MTLAELVKVAREEYTAGYEKAYKHIPDLCDAIEILIGQAAGDTPSHSNLTLPPREHCAICAQGLADDADVVIMLDVHPQCLGAARLAAQARVTP